MRHIDETATTFFLDSDAEPIHTLANGERTSVDTPDSVCGIAKRSAPRGLQVADVIEELGGACPLIGPLAVQGAEPGDCLEIEIHSVVPRPVRGRAWTAVFGDFGALTSGAYTLDTPLPPTTTLLDYDTEVAYLPTDRGAVPIPLSPFLGTVGVAPRRERRMSFSQDPEYLGDVDLPALTAGATLVLPVNVPGGLFSLGDAHGAQGEGEITGAAVEIEARVELTARVSHPEAVGFHGLPQINTAERIGSVAGMHGVGVTACARAAYRDLVHRLVSTRGFGVHDAYQLLGQVGKLSVGNMIAPFYSVLATVERRYVD